MIVKVYCLEHYTSWNIGLVGNILSTLFEFPRKLEMQRILQQISEEIHWLKYHGYVATLVAAVFW